jgi:NAD(P) transhydrogenase subunit alpha
MKIGVIREREKGEMRVAITPDVVKLYIKAGFKICIEKGVGISAGYLDEEYKTAGAEISSVPLEILSDADIILKVRPTPKQDKINEIEFAKPGSSIIGFLSHHNNSELIAWYNSKKINAFAMELVPRITKAQTMDALSSQSNLAGYRAVIEGVYHMQQAAPMMMTAAGTIHPIIILVLGAGVAGLQAIATAKRLGAVVYAFDVRLAAKEQVESLGGKFISVEGAKDLQTTGGYAKEASAEYKMKQQQLIADYVKKSDIVVTTALIPGKPAPILVTKEMVEHMKSGSVVIDLAAVAGGNCEATEMDKIIEYKEVKVVGDTNIISKLAKDASKLYAKNLYNFVIHSYGKEKKIDFTDEIVANMLVTTVPT